MRRQDAQTQNKRRQKLKLSVSALLWYVSRVSAYRNNAPGSQVSVDGVWDLRGCDLVNQIESLEGEYAYVPHALLTPAEFSAYGGKIVFSSVPGNMKVATARLRILVPPGRWMLAGNSIDYNERIFINGELRAEVGRPGLTKETSVPGLRYMQLEIAAPDGVIEIVRQSSNFVHKEGGGYSNLSLGGPDVVRRRADSAAGARRIS
jgi:hypothetical protein